MCVCSNTLGKYLVVATVQSATTNTTAPDEHYKSVQQLSRQQQQHKVTTKEGNAPSAALAAAATANLSFFSFAHLYNKDALLLLSSKVVEQQCLIEEWQLIVSTADRQTSAVDM